MLQLGKIFIRFSVPKKSTNGYNMNKKYEPMLTILPSLNVFNNTLNFQSFLRILSLHQSLMHIYHWRDTYPYHIHNP